MRSAPLISIIVPVFKVERFLRRCVDSIIAQTYENLEIILIDDGSPDKSPQICDEYAAKDPRIKVIHQPNSGVSAARNAGLDTAKGEYIAFVDSDDWIDKDMYKNMLYLAQKEGADMVVCSVYSVTKQETTISENCQEKLTTEQIKYKLATDDFKSYPWNRLIKKTLLQDRKFPTGIIYCEDRLFLAKPVLDAKKIIFTPTPYYYYNRANENSATAMPISAKAKYGIFLAWREYERLTSRDDIRAYCQAKALRYAIRALCLNLAQPQLEIAQTKFARLYLDETKQVSFKIDAKHRLLLWGLYHLPFICKMFGRFTIYQRNRKLKIRTKSQNKAQNRSKNERF